MRERERVTYEFSFISYSSSARFPVLAPSCKYCVGVEGLGKEESKGRERESACVYMREREREREREDKKFECIFCRRRRRK